MVTADTDVCADRVLCALGALEPMKVDANDTALRQAMAARFGARFDARDRLYNAGRPQWHQFVDEAVKRVVDEKAASQRTPKAAAKNAETRDPPRVVFDKDGDIDPQTMDELTDAIRADGITDLVVFSPTRCSSSPPC